MDVDTPTKLLLIESDERLGELTARYLRHHGFVVAIERDGPRATELQGYTCIVVGLLRTGRDGIEVARELSNCTDVPIVASWSLDPGDAAPRPILSGELLRRIRAAIAAMRDTPRLGE